MRSACTKEHHSLIHTHAEFMRERKEKNQKLYESIEFNASKMVRLFPRVFSQPIATCQMLLVVLWSIRAQVVDSFNDGYWNAMHSSSSQLNNQPASFGCQSSGRFILECLILYYRWRPTKTNIVGGEFQWNSILMHWLQQIHTWAVRKHM